MSGPGVHITFYDPGESAGRALPPFGPLIDVVVRPRKLVAERRSTDIPADPGLSIGRWLEAQLEFHRATGEEAGGTKRSKMRVTAEDGLFLRFVTFNGPLHGSALPELGPFKAVSVGEIRVEADGIVIAVRKPNDTTWELTAEAGADMAGARKSDIGFRSRSTSYHRGIDTRPKPATPPGAATAKKPPRPIGVFAPPLAELERARGAHERLDREQLEEERSERERLALAERKRIESERQRIEQERIEEDRLERQRQGHARAERERAEEEARLRRVEAERRSRVPEMATAPLTSRVGARPPAPTASVAQVAPQRSLLWRLRFVLGGLLLLGAIAYGVTLTRGGFSVPTGGAVVRTAGIGDTVRGTRWDYVLNNVARAQNAGAARPRGVFIVVRLGVTNRGAEGAEPSHAGFTLIDAAGKQYTPESLRGEAYASQTAFTWPRTFPVGQPVTAPLVFDVDPAARGLLLVISDVPQTRIRID